MEKVRIDIMSRLPSQREKEAVKSRRLTVLWMDNDLNLEEYDE